MAGGVYFKDKTQKMPFLPAQHSLPQVCTISRGYICKPLEGRKGKKMASANQPKRITIIFGVGFLLLIIYTKIHCKSQMFTPTGRSSKPSKQ